MDVFTDKPEIPIKFKLNDYFVGLKVIARNSFPNREIAFLENEDIAATSPTVVPIILNLDPLSTFPDAQRSFSNDKNLKLKHVKFEIEYILYNPKIEDLKDDLLDKIKGIIIPKKVATIQIPSLIQPEIYITLPPGWRISGKPEGTSVGMKYFIQSTQSDNGIDMTKSPKPQSGKINLEEPFIKRSGERLTYNYVINKEDYELIKTIKNNSSLIGFELTYISQVSSMVAWISIIPFIVFLPLSVIILYCGLLSVTQKFPFNFDSSFGVGYLLLLLSFMYFYYDLIREDFHIPYKNLHIPIFAFTVSVILSIFLKNVAAFQAFLRFLFP